MFAGRPMGSHAESNWRLVPAPPSAPGRSAGLTMHWLQRARRGLVGDVWGQLPDCRYPSRAPRRGRAGARRRRRRSRRGIVVLGPSSVHTYGPPLAFASSRWTPARSGVGSTPLRAESITEAPPSPRVPRSFPAPSKGTLAGSREPWRSHGGAQRSSRPPLTAPGYLRSSNSRSDRRRPRPKTP
jgi:hypothetical protein